MAVYSLASLSEDDWDNDWHGAGTVGFILLSNCERITDEMTRFFPKQFGVQFTRLPGTREVTVESLRANESFVADCAARFTVPNMKVMCFGCTSASFIIGLDKTKRLISTGAKIANSQDADEVIPTTLTDCVLEALKATLWKDQRLTAKDASTETAKKRIVLLTPYIEEVNRVQVPVFERELPGLEIIEIQGMDINDAGPMHRPSPEAVKRLAYQLFFKHVGGKDKAPTPSGSTRRAHSAPDGIFISCGCLPSLQIIKDLEQEIFEGLGWRVPVISANGAMLWHCARLAGHKDRLENVGMLGEL